MSESMSDKAWHREIQWRHSRGISFDTILSPREREELRRAKREWKNADRRAANAESRAQRAAQERAALGIPDDAPARIVEIMARQAADDE